MYGIVLVLEDKNQLTITDIESIKDLESISNELKECIGRYSSFSIRKSFSLKEDILNCYFINSKKIVMWRFFEYVKQK